MASTSLLRRRTGCWDTASRPTRGAILLGARACAERAYLDWKWTVNALWEDKRHRLQTAARQCHLDEETARQCQAAAAAHARQEAARCQQLLDEQAARTRQEAAAARTRQEAAAARARQEASKFAASMALLWANMAELRRAAEALALDEERHRHEAVLTAEANNRRRHEVAARAAEALTLDEECHHHEAVLAAEADDRRPHEAAARAAEALILVEECRRHKAATRALLSTVSPLADKQSCHEAAARATASAKLALAVRPHAQPRHCTG
jgi:hypothetical protein